MKCKFYKNCKYYRKDSVTCNKTGGQYYSYSRYAGCYRDQEEIFTINQYIKLLEKDSVHQATIKILNERLRELTDE